MANHLRALNLAFVTISDTRTDDTDVSGQQAVDLACAQGHVAVSREIVPDERSLITSRLQDLVRAEGVDVIVTSGGTGLTARDVTIEAVGPLVTKWIPGFGELFRMLSFQQIGASTIQSRSEAALCDKTLVFLLPGSPGAVRLAMSEIVLPQLDSRTKPCNFAQLMSRF